jgi:hypothetical protein
MIPKASRTRRGVVRRSQIQSIQTFVSKFLRPAIHSILFGWKRQNWRRRRDSVRRPFVRDRSARTGDSAKQHEFSTPDTCSIPQFVAPVAGHLGCLLHHRQSASTTTAE